MNDSVAQYADSAKRRFHNDLSAYGPDSRRATPSIQESLDYCRDLANQHYENFTVASWLLPLAVRQHFCNVYAYCRWADDLSDEIRETDQSLKLLSWWREQTQDCFANTDSQVPQHPVFIALRQTLKDFELSSVDFEKLIDAFEQDQKKSRYETHDEILDYCSGSANPVGRIVLRLARSYSDANAELSDRICEGLQIANFAQDIYRDALIDRIYMPRELYEPNGISETDILNIDSAADVQKERLKTAVLKWAALGRRQIESGRALIERVPSWLARNVYLFSGGGLAILDEIDRLGGDVWSNRVSVGKLTKLKLIAVAPFVTRFSHFYSRRRR